LDEPFPKDDPERTEEAVEHDMIQVDGSTKSGSGTILRYAMALSSLLGEEVGITNIRTRRKNPGLRAQHLRSAMACCEMTGGTLEGAKVNSTRLRYTPGPGTNKTQFRWDIGTAGSTTMLALTVLPFAAFASAAVRIRMSGGLFQDFAPSAYHMQHVLLPMLERMGLKAALRIIRPGYVPKGGGQIELEVSPVHRCLDPITLSQQGRILQVQGISLASHLRQQRVSTRMAEKCRKVLRANGLDVDFEILEDDSSSQKGAALFIAAASDQGCLIGADQAGAVGRSSEAIGEFVARLLLDDLKAGATVDRYLADQLILFAGLAAGTTVYVIPRMTEHIETNLWLIETVLGAAVDLEGSRLTIKGTGFAR
jgi:RNA 3'-terminal phosphate cyclase (ATP)